MPLSIRALSVLALAGALFAILFTKSSAEPPDAELRQKFEEAATGQFESDGGTGDGIADDLLEVMRQNPIADRLPTDPWLDEEDSRPENRTPRRRASKKAAVAEQMLRAARLLEKVGEYDSDRVALVKKMRSEARQLLTD